MTGEGRVGETLVEVGQMHDVLDRQFVGFAVESSGLCSADVVLLTAVEDLVEE